MKLFKTSDREIVLQYCQTACGCELPIVHEKTRNLVIYIPPISHDRNRNTADRHVDRIEKKKIRTPQTGQVREPTYYITDFIRHKW